MNDPRLIKQAVEFSTIGIELSALVLLFVYGGYRLDKWLGLLPVFTLLGALVGMIIGFYRIYLALAADDAKSKDDISKRR